MPRILLPAGMFNGCSSSYSICQLKSNLGTSRIVCSRPSGYTITQRELVRHRPLVEPDAELRAIFFGFAGRVVVHLPVDVLACGNPLADVGAMRIDAASRHPREELVRAGQRRRVGATREPFAAIRCGL